MPSTSKQKAKEKRSTQLDVMSDLNDVPFSMDVMLGVHSRNDLQSNQADRNVDVTLSPTVHIKISIQIVKLLHLY